MTDTVAGTRIRQRLLATLFAAAGVNRTAFIAAVTVAPLAAADMLGAARWSGIPNALATFGLAVGVAPLAGFMAKYGRRPGFALSLTIAAGGMLAAGVAVRAGAFPLLLAGFFVFGLGASGDRLSRYAAADVAPPHMRASAISAIVWAGTVGSVAGPLLLAPSERLATTFGFPELAGGFLVAAVLVGVAAVLLGLLLRPDPLTLAEGYSPVGVGVSRTERTPLAPIVGTPLVRYALAALGVGQFVMVLIMAMTPIHIREAGENLTLVGLVIGAHTFGMFFFSPVTGWLADRYGKVRIIVAGQLLLVVAALMAAPAGGSDRALLIGALFLLGVGWNFGFVAASALVTDAATGGTRVRLQGVADAMTWISGAVAAVASGIILDWQSFSVLALAGAAAAVAVMSLRLRYREALSRPEPVSDERTSADPVA